MGLPNAESASSFLIVRIFVSPTTCPTAIWRATRSFPIRLKDQNNNPAVAPWFASKKDSIHLRGRMGLRCLLTLVKILLR